MLEGRLHACLLRELELDREGVHGCAQRRRRVVTEGRHVLAEPAFHGWPGSLDCFTEHRVASGDGLSVELAAGERSLQRADRISDLPRTDLAPLLGEIPATGYVFAAVALFAARPISLTSALLGSKLQVRERIVAAWFGPKGFASVVYGLLILHSDVAARNELFHLVALVVVASIIAHSSTDVVAARWFVPKPTETRPPVVHVDGPSTS